MIQTPSEMMRDLVQRALDNAGFLFTVREEDLLYGVPGASDKGVNSSVGVEILNQPVKPRDIVLHYNRLDLEVLTSGMASYMKVDQLPETVYEALPYLATYLRIRLGEADVEDATIVNTGEDAIITLIAKPGSLVVIGAVEIHVRAQGSKTWIT